MITFEQEILHHQIPLARIKVIGVGGGGGNQVNSMINEGLEFVEFIVANTDAQALKLSQSPFKIQLGSKSTKGFGAGANPEVGKRAAEEDNDNIIKHVEGADIVFLVGGLGGGTASGALPVITKAIKSLNILTVAVVTKPFTFEGKRRMTVAETALEQIKKEVDTLLVIPNQKLLDLTDEKVSLMDAFGMINTVINQLVRSMVDIIARPGHINVDFADVKTTISNKGLAVMGTGSAKGANRAQEAALSAISSPLLENMSIAGARSILLNITGGPNLGLHEVNEAASIIYEQAHEDATIIFGSVIDPTITDEVMVTVIATNFAVPESSVAPAMSDYESSRLASPSTLLQEQAAQQPINTTDLEVPTLLRRMIKERQLQQQK
jgi:cell division protein FtsZ